MQDIDSIIQASFLNKQHFIKNFHFTDESDLIELSCSSSDSLCSETDQHICGNSCLNIRIREVRFSVM